MSQEVKQRVTITLLRDPSLSKFTRGKIYHKNNFLCHTLEHVVREKAGVPVASWKVNGVTAIPSGTYRLTLENSPRFGASTLTLHDVPGFSAIRMHGGNTVDDSQGCPLLGMATTANGISNCAPAIDKVRSIVRGSAIDVYLEIKNAGSHV